ncbi:MAG: DNA cytosine methyltransferase, partial [Pseudomonadota bacterium]
VFCEKDKKCRAVLERTWPGIPIVPDIREFDGTRWRGRFLLTGGDPCPIRSKARSIWGTKHPDLSGYFLAVVGASRPEWVVRENVPAPDDVDFVAGLGTLGYGSIIVRANADTHTGQCRQRDIIVGCYKTRGRDIRKCFPNFQDGAGTYTTRLGTREIIPALTTHRTRYDSRDCYIFDNSRLRILDSEERERFAGFPSGWTAGFSPATRARMLGNSIVPQVAYEIIKAIMEA